MSDPQDMSDALPLPDTRARLGDRSLFPDLAPRLYLSHAAISPPSLPVREMVATAQRDYATHGVGAFRRWHAQRLRLKERLARLFGGAPADYALVLNTTTGINAVATCFPWRRGDRVVLFEGEFPTNVTPWQRAAARHDLELVFLPLDDLSTGDLGRFEATLKQGVRLVAASAVQFQTGLRMPVEQMADLCHAHGAEICVDAIQACGVVPLDLARFDYAACGGHKWLMGPEGAGFLFVHPDRVGALRPELAGWLSHEDPVDFLFEGPGRLRYDKPIRRQADFLEGGAPNTIGYGGLEAALGLIEQLGVEAVAAHVRAWNDAAEAALVARGFESLRSPDPARQSGILSFRTAAPAATWVARLGERGVTVTGPDGLLRLAPHWPNALAEVPLLADAVDEVIAAAR